MHVPWWAWAAANALNDRSEDLNLSFTLSLHSQGNKGKSKASEKHSWLLSWA